MSLTGWPPESLVPKPAEKDGLAYMTKREIFALEIYCAMIVAHEKYSFNDATLLADGFLERLAK